MDIPETRALISVLIDSSLYLSLSLKERTSLSLKLLTSYPFLFASKGYASRETGVRNMNSVREASMSALKIRLRAYEMECKRGING